MISAFFVDRPRLAVVVAAVITIPGLLALTRIPVAQLPDIAPPQVQVSATYPGASAAVVEASVAQPIEAQVVGVDKMLYMKSTSANDGSYNLTVSFALDSDPDINTVSVNNRVQTALAQLPAEVQLEGLTVQKKSSAILQFLSLYSDNGQQDPLFITNYRDHQHHGRPVAPSRRRSGAYLRGAQLFDARLVRYPAARQSATNTR
jgi:hydrophobic/amphiphilic exporter-1 (mainly G- bacteria), HAE1 family